MKLAYAKKAFNEQAFLVKYPQGNKAVATSAKENPRHVPYPCVLIARLA